MCSGLGVPFMGRIYAEFQKGRNLVIFWSLAMNTITILAGIQVSYASVPARPQ